MTIKAHFYHSVWSFVTNNPVAKKSLSGSTDLS